MAVCERITVSTMASPYALMALPVCEISRPMSTAPCFTFDSVFPHDSYTTMPLWILGGVLYFWTAYAAYRSPSPTAASLRCSQSSAR